MTNRLSILPKRENKASAVSTENSLKVDFLVFTRFENERLDYKFYVASQDQTLTEIIRKNLIPQESNSELPYEAFFVYKNYCVLTIAELWINSNNSARKDNVGRDILRRLFFVWDFSKQPSWLRYEHLLFLLQNLREATKLHVDIVPNDNKETTPKYYSFNFTRSDFQDGCAKISNGYETDYSKFLGSNQKNIQLRKVNIAAPNNWTFDQQILLLKGLNVSDVNYSVWNKVFSKISPRFEKLLSENRWIALNRTLNQISLFDSQRGNLIEKIDANEDTINADDFGSTGAIKNQYDTESKDSEFSNSYELHNIEIINSIEFLKREINFFVCSDSEFRCSIFDSWNNLLNEIRLYYSNTSKKQKLEWIRRLDSIRHILEEEVDITDYDRFAYETSFSLLTKTIFELIEDE